jgi:hypothetical protein
MNKLYSYIKNFKFNNFIISQYQLRHGGNKIGIFSLFLNKNVFEYINTHFRVIISLPLDDIMNSVHTIVLKNK